MISASLLAALQTADQSLRAGDYAGAHARLEVITREHPGATEAQRMLAGVKLALGDATGAETILRAVAAREPVWPPVLTMLGELLLGSGRTAEAEAFLARAATGNPADPRAALVLCRHHNARQRPAQAIAIAAPLCATGKAAPELAEQHVAALAALGRAPEAVSFYRDIVARTPGSPAAEHALAIALQACGQHEEAGRIAEHCAATGHRSAALGHARARSLIALGRFADAEAALHDCLQQEPRRVEAHDDLARLVWMRSGDAAEATAALDAALRQYPDDDALLAAKAAVLQGAGDPRAAHACLAERAARDGAPPALCVRAGLAALEFDPTSAADLAGRALRTAPGDVPARKLMAAARLGVGDAAAALQLCEALLADEPDEQYLIALQTTAWRMLGDERYARCCDYKELAVPYRLEAPRGWRDLDGFLADLKQSLGKMHDALRHPLLFQSLRHGTETTENLARSVDPVVQALFTAFDAPIRDYMARMGHGDDPLRRRNHGSYRFNGSWSVRLRSSGFHHNHVHPRGWISSACYVELPAAMEDPSSREGALAFGEPGILTSPPLAAEHALHPAVGMLVLFPSYCWHGTVPFSGSDTRLTVAFDAIPGV
ncbi:MAG TPA: tetratricopeptide repeat protein [Rhodanobacteraceae bacterium]|jgi:predicted Zn-dependent protease|nr:tetratricopeptide repeat protein [Rhodanobacteraceae bacterium]